MGKQKLFTIGHSNHEIGYFIELLTLHGIDCVVDVRSIAASRFNPQFNKKNLGESLKEKGIAYLHMPDEFGARKTSPDVLTSGKVDFEKVRASSAFRRGLDRLNEGLKKGYTIALMCAEADPLDCHRFSMITYALREDYEVVHILKDGRTINNQELEHRLIEKFNLPLEIAYKAQAFKIGFTPK